MSLVDRMAGFVSPEIPGNSQIPVLEFWAMLYELAQGQVTQAAIVDRYSLTVDEQGELQWIITKYNAQPNANAKAKFVELIRVIFLLAEGRVPGYTTNAEVVARVNAI